MEGGILNIYHITSNVYTNMHIYKSQGVDVGRPQVQFRVTKYTILSIVSLIQ